MVESPMRESKLLKKASGIFNELELYPDRLVLRHTDILSRFFGHDEVIPLRDIKSVHVYPAQFITPGWLRLVVMRHERKPLGMAFRQADERQMYDMQATLTDLISRREVVPILQTMQA
jgi:hypothetical protein